MSSVDSNRERASGADWRSEPDRRIVEIDVLLKNFGAKLVGYDPGVTARFLDDSKNPRALGYRGAGAFGEPLSFSWVAWRWLEPLLKELLAARAASRGRETPRGGDSA